MASPPRPGRSRGPGRRGSAHGLCHEEHCRGAPRERTRFGLLPTHTCGNPCSKRVAQWIADVLQKKANCLTERFPMAMNTASGILLPRRPDDRAEARSGSRTTLRRCSTRHGKPHETNERERTKQLCAEEEKKIKSPPPHDLRARKNPSLQRAQRSGPGPQKTVRRAGNVAREEIRLLARTQQRRRAQGFARVDRQSVCQWSSPCGEMGRRYGGEGIERRCADLACAGGRANFHKGSAALRL